MVRESAILPANGLLQNVAIFKPFANIGMNLKVLEMARYRKLFQANVTPKMLGPHYFLPEFSLEKA